MGTERRGIQSVEVGGQLLVALVDAGGPMGLKELASRAGMSSAKAHPYLVSFGKLGLVQQDPVTSRYELGPFALQMGLISLQLLDPVRIAVPEIAPLGESLQLTVALAVLGNHGPTIVWIDEARAPIHVNMRSGTVMSNLHTATGLTFAAWLPQARLQALLLREAADAAPDGPATSPVDADVLSRMLAEVRKHGVGRTVGQPIAGINAMSAPVFDHRGDIVLAITAIGPAGTFDADWNGTVADALRGCARRVSQRLGHRG